MSGDSRRNGGGDFATAGDHEVTRLLELWSTGDVRAFEELFPLVYDQLRSLAAGFLHSERSGHTLQPTALVNEAYVRLTGRNQATVRDRAHFFAIAAQAMRRILVDHARRHCASKRINPRQRVSLDEAPSPTVAVDVDFLALHEALEDLGDINSRQSQVVELRYFGGLTSEEAAVALDVSIATVERDWYAARLWLRRHLAMGDDGGP